MVIVAARRALTRATAAAISVRAAVRLIKGSAVTGLLLLSSPSGRGLGVPDTVIALLAAIKPASVVAIAPVPTPVVKTSTGIDDRLLLCWFSQRWQ